MIGYRVAMSLLEAGHKDVRVGVWKGSFAVDQAAGSQGMEEGSGQKMAEILKEKGADIVDFDWSKEEGKQGKNRANAEDRRSSCLLTQTLSPIETSSFSDQTTAPP